MNPGDTNGKTRAPIKWNKLDEDRWEHDLVMCPQARAARKPERKWCLSAGEMDAISNGFIVIWKERKETEEKTSLYAKEKK
jgi:hypothetical protein